MFVFDSDFGIDDAVALIVAFKHLSMRNRQFYITTVAGNVDVQVASRNAQIIASLLDLPSFTIFQGSASPLIPHCQKVSRWEGHQQDGLGSFSKSQEWIEFQKTHPPESRTAKYPIDVDTHAAIHLIELSKKFPHQITLVLLGPLTNIGLAISIDHTFLTRIKRIIGMGGSLHGKGNSNRSAEFNFHADPEAAKIVFDSMLSLSLTSAPLHEPLLTLVPWETSIDQGFCWSVHDSISLFKSPQSKLFHGILRFYRQMAQEKLNGLILPDVYAIAALVEPDCVLEYEDVNSQIEVFGSFTRGMMCVDWMGDSPKNCRIITKMNSEHIHELLLKSFE